MDLLLNLFAAIHLPVGYGLTNSCSSRRRLLQISAWTRIYPFQERWPWPYFYPWPQRAPGLIETAFDELAKRWRPILDEFDARGVNLSFEIHPGEDVHDGVTFEASLNRLDGHKRCNILFDPSHFVLQRLDYLEFIDLYHSRIKMFHVKDAEF
jgi:sugar phosphate isomerase/epimerase